MHDTQPPPADEVDQLVAAIGQIPQPWPPIPRGWPGEAEAALIDAVFSMRTVYGDSETTGVRAIVGRWRANRGAGPIDDLRVLAAQDPEDLLTLFGNRQKVPGPNPLTKAGAVVRAAGNLVDAGYPDAASLVTDGLAGAAGRAYMAVPGLGWITWTYFLMLLGVPGVKADIMVCRFVRGAVITTRTLDAQACGALVVAAAENLREDPIRVDHIIWNHQRGLPGT